jgi:hypothetical protein
MKHHGKLEMLREIHESPIGDHYWINRMYNIQKQLGGKGSAAI